MVKRLSPGFIGLLLFTLAVLFFTNCTSKATQMIEPTVLPETPKIQIERWQEELERTKAEAVKEGSLLIYTSSGPAVVDPVTKAIREKYGVNLEWVTGRTGDNSERIITEQRAGLYHADVWFSGPGGNVVFKDQKAVQTLDNVLFLPEVLDKKAWWSGDLIFLDKEHTWVSLSASPQPYIFINTDMVKPGEVKGWRDLLDPKWKGKIVLYDPTKTGAGADWACSISEIIMGPDYLREFARQEPIILGDSRQQCEWVARGKYPVAVAARTENMVEFKTLGSPVQIISSIEGVHLATSLGVSLFKNAPHPNAAKLFLNWVLTKEGGTLIAQVGGSQSARLDVPSDFLDPTFVRQPGQRYFNAITEEYTLEKEVFIKTTKEIFGPLLK